MKIKEVLNSYALLLVNPVLFFKNRDASAFRKYSTYAAWMVGIANAMNRFDTQYDEPRWIKSLSPAALGDSWALYWMYMAARGAVVGLFLWYFNGLLFRTFILWSKGEYQDKRDTREKRAYLGLTSAVPKILIMLIASVTSANYGEYLGFSHLELFTVLPFMLWEQISLARAAHGLYKADGKRAILWFVGLPVSLVALGYTILLAMGLS